MSAALEWQDGLRVRSTRDGQLGWLETRDDGVKVVRLDRRDYQSAPWNPSAWKLDRPSPMTDIQIARVVYEADRNLRLVLGEYGVKPWQDLREPDRVSWIAGPPPKPAVKPLRRELADAIRKTLAGRSGRE